MQSCATYHGFGVVQLFLLLAIGVGSFLISLRVCLTFLASALAFACTALMSSPTAFMSLLNGTLGSGNSSVALVACVEGLCWFEPSVFTSLLLSFLLLMAPLVQAYLGSGISICVVGVDLTVC